MKQRHYIVSCDLSKRFAQLEQHSLKLPSDYNKFFQEFNNSLQNVLQCALPNAEIVFIDIDEMAAEILSVTNQKDTKDAFVVSTNVDFAVPSRGRTLEINRLVNASGDIIGFGPRPGHASLQKQIADIKQIAGNRPIVIVEDGIFSGNTIVHILKMLRDVYVKVSHIIVGFAFPDGIANIRAQFPDIEIIFIHEIDDMVDWVPDHDFFPCAPNCGRVIGSAVADVFTPLYDHQGSSFCVPYLHPFCPMTNWTSVPNSDVYAVSRLCMQKSAEFFEKLDIANGMPLQFRHMQGLNPRVSIPVCVDTTIFRNKYTKISSYLQEMLLEMD